MTPMENTTSTEEVPSFPGRKNDHPGKSLSAFAIYHSVEITMDAPEN